MNLLFICSQNQWRSPTAERVFRDLPGYAVRSRGTRRSAVRKIQVSDLEWADLIFVMEHKHKERLRSDFPTELRRRRVEVLEIPDDFTFMDPELVAILEASVSPILERFDL